MKAWYKTGVVETRSQILENVVSQGRPHYRTPKVSTSQGQAAMVGQNTFGGHRQIYLDQSFGGHRQIYLDQRCWIGRCGEVAQNNNHLDNQTQNTASSRGRR